MVTLTVKELIDKAVKLGLHNSQLSMDELIYLQLFNDNRKSQLISGTQLIEEANGLINADNPHTITDVNEAIQVIHDSDEDRFIWEIEE